MEKEDNYSASFPGAGFDYSIDHNQPQQHDHHHMIKSRINETQSENSIEMVDYMLDNPPSQQQQRQISTLDHVSFADVMQFADFGPRLGFTHQSAITSTNSEEEESGIDPVHFLKFPVLNESLVLSPTVGENDQRKKSVIEEDEEGELREEGEKCNLENNNNNNNSSVQLQFVGDNENNNNTRKSEAKNKRKRARTLKTNEEVESQRMTHIAVERNRRKQMNEHLRVLRSLMPGSYVQRGDQASIIGGAIEFVRELEQLLQCLESQKRRRLYGDAPRGTMGESSSLSIQQQPQPPLIFPLPPPNDQMKIVGFEPGLQEETSEMKSCLADVEVKLLGFDAMIKILSRRRPGQLIKTIAALEDLQLNILHTNITTIEHTVLYSFNVKVTGEAHCTAEDIANSVQQIFSFIHASSSI